MFRWYTAFLSWSNLIFLIGLLLVSCGLFILYRLLFHPLRNFPGERLAAISGWHWDLHGCDPDFLGRLHRIYGPVVRIAPNELHFSQPTAYASIYAIGSKFTKDPQYYAAFPDGALFATADPRQAKSRRDIIRPMFSRHSVLKLESVVQEKVDILVAQMISHGSHPVDLHYALRSATLDIITSYCFAQSWSTLKYPLFQHPILHAMTQQLTLMWVLHAFPILRKIFPFLSPILMLVGHSIKATVDFRGKMAAQIDELLRDPESLKRAEHETVYHHLVTRRPGKDPHDIPPRNSLLSEGVSLVVAGSDAGGGTLTVGVFHVLQNKRVSSSLVKQLDAAWPDKNATMKFEELEKLPYLTAVIKESLRLFSGVVSPSPRIVGPSSARIAGVDVPAGTSVSITTPFLHHNPDIFHDPTAFIPERWLQSNSRELENFLVPFARGPRSCLGINLAWCEMYLILGNMFRKINMEIYDTSIEDFKQKMYFLPVFTGKHLRANIKERDS